MDQKLIMLEPVPEETLATGKVRKKRKKLSKQIVNVFRTTARNNIDLTAIADNKASILMSLNALMITFITPMIIAYSDMIIAEYLFVPLGIFISTCAITIYLSSQVLKPSDFDKIGEKMKFGKGPSPFFFGNFYYMPPEDYFEFIQGSLGDEELLKNHLAQDLYYVGRRLGKKMTGMRLAFQIFISGILLTLLSTFIVIWLF